MTQPDQPLDLAAIQARADAATPGPWVIEWDADDVSDAPFPISIGPFCYLEHQGERDAVDAKFIESARTDVPALLAEVQRLGAELAEARGHAELFGRKLTDALSVLAARNH